MGGRDGGERGRGTKNGGEGEGSATAKGRVGV